MAAEIGHPTFEELKNYPIDVILPLTLATFCDAFNFLEPDLLGSELHKRVDAVQRILYQTHSRLGIQLTGVTSGIPRWQDKIGFCIKCLIAAGQEKFHGIYGFSEAGVLACHLKWFEQEMKRLGIKYTD